MSRRNRHPEEEHTNHERWLVTYADMVTLLMVLFIVMFAMSQVDEKKFNALKEGLAAGFGQSTSLLDGSSSILEQPGTAITAPVAPATLAADLPPKEQAAVARALEHNDRVRRQQEYTTAELEVDRLEGIRKKLFAALDRAGLRGDVRTVLDERGLTVSLVSRHVVFEPNMVELAPRGRQVVGTLAPVLNSIHDPLAIDGHTNQVKVKPKYFPTDWELSAARAVRVLRYLNESWHVPNHRMTASAFGHEKPIVDPSRPGSQKVNKRVDIVVQSSLPSETRALMKQVLTARQLPGGESS